MGGMVSLWIVWRTFLAGFFPCRVWRVSRTEVFPCAQMLSRFESLKTLGVLPGQTETLGRPLLQPGGLCHLWVPRQAPCACSRCPWLAIDQSVPYPSAISTGDPFMAWRAGRPLARGCCVPPRLSKTGHPAHLTHRFSEYNLAHLNLAPALQSIFSLGGGTLEFRHSHSCVRGGTEGKVNPSK